MRSAAELVARAVERAGSEDFGGDDWREGLDRLVHALASDASLTTLGEKVVGLRLRRLLESRLRIEATYRQHPEIDGQLVEAPVFVVGLPRTGTTALSNLIACDPGLRSLRLWESLEPVPAPDAATEDADPRVAATQLGLDAMHAAYPRMRALYPQAAAWPTECQDLLGMAFRTLHFDGMARVPSYTDWVLGADLAPAYRYHLRALKLLQWRRPPNRWHLKSPVHLAALETLDAVYPGARFVWTHRDPAAAIGSVCSLVTYLRAMVSERDDRAETGERQLALWAEAVRRGIAFRDRAGEERFADVRNADLAADPIGTVRGAYERLGLSVGAAHERAMRARLDAEPRGAHGIHAYDLSDHGLDPVAVRERFGAYLERFAAHTHSPGSGSSE